MTRTIEARQLRGMRSRLEARLTQAQDIFEPLIRNDLELPTRTWRFAKPKFQYNRRRQDGSRIFEVLVQTGDPQVHRAGKRPVSPGRVWLWIDQGAKPHEIEGRRGNLAFLRDYKAATKRGRLVSEVAMKSGPLIIRKAVDHPGVQAREYVRFLRDPNRGGHDTQFAQLMRSIVRR